jgi:hypothetical protein
MVADSDSSVAWHRVQLRKNRAALKALEAGRFASGEIASRRGQMSRAIADLKQKIAQSERCIALYERQSRRPVATDFGSLTGVNWSHWTGRGGDSR